MPPSPASKVSEGGDSPPCGTVVAALRERVTRSVACKRTRQWAIAAKKSARTPGRYQPGGLRALSPNHRCCLSLWRPTIIRHTMSIDLVEGGLAMMPTKAASLALPCAVSRALLASSPDLILLSPTLRNKMAPADPACGRMASAGPPRRERVHNTASVGRLCLCEASG